MTPAPVNAAAIPAADPEVRRTGIGSSDMAAIVGLNPWRSAIDVWMEKRGLTEPGETSEAAYWGNVLEPVLLEEYARREGLIVVGRDRDGEIRAWHPEGAAVSRNRSLIARPLLYTLRHPEHPWMMAHLDGLAYDPKTLELVRVIEVKTASAFRAGDFGQEDTDELPEEYVVQIQHAAEIVRATLGRAVPVDGPVLLGGQRWRLYRIAHDPRIAELLIDTGSHFWDLVEEGVPPAPEGDGRGARALARLYPQHTDEEIVVAPMTEEEELLAELEDARRAAKAADDRKVAAENAVKARMGDAGAMICGFGKVTWRKSKDREVVDWQGVALALASTYADGPEQLERARGEHTTTKPGPRVFRPTFTEPKGGTD